MGLLKKPQTKVVDNLKTQLEELLEALNKLYDELNTEFTRLGSDAEEMHTIMIEGFRNVLDKEPPVEPVSSASSFSGSDDEEDEENSNQSLNEDADSEDKQKAADKSKDMDNLMRMIQSWSSAGQ